MKLEKLSSGSYRYRKQVNGKRISLIFDHKPTQREILVALSAEMEKTDNLPKSSMYKCALNYIETKDAILSPSTKRSYHALIRGMSEEFKKIDINDVTAYDVQVEINQYTKTHSAKTTANYHGFISAFLGLFRPTLTLHTTLPQKVKYEPYTPSEDDIRRVLDAVKDTKYSVGFQLGVLGLRRSEVCGLDLSDLDGNELHIHRTKVQNEYQKWELKELTKTEDGKRKIYIPDSLVNEIRSAGTIYDGDPSSLLYNLHAIQKRLNIPQFRFHDLRGFYASYAHSKGVPDAVIMESGGWRSDYVMKSVYRHAMENDKRTYQQKIASDIFTLGKIPR